jgi:hypothetical protein
MWNLENGRTQQQARYLWLSAVILVNLEAEIRRILVQSQSGQMLHETLFQKYWAHGCTHMRTRTHTHKPTQETPATNLRKKTKDNTNIKRLAGIVAHWYSTCLASTSPWFQSLAQQKKKKKKKSNGRSDTDSQTWTYQGIPSSVNIWYHIDGRAHYLLHSWFQSSGERCKLKTKHFESNRMLELPKFLIVNEMDGLQGRKVTGQKT